MGTAIDRNNFYRHHRRLILSTIAALVTGTAMLTAAITIAPHPATARFPSQASTDTATTAVSVADAAQINLSTSSPIIGTVRADPYVTIRSGPGTEYPPSSSGNASTGTNFQVLCYASSTTPVSGWGGTNSEWDRVADPTNPSQSLGYIADVWLDTRDDAHTSGDITAEVPNCSTTGDQSSTSAGQGTSPTDGNGLKNYWWGVEVDLNAYWADKLEATLYAGAGAATIVAVIAAAVPGAQPAALPAGLVAGVLGLGGGAIQFCSDDNGVALYLTDIGTPWCSGR